MTTYLCAPKLQEAFEGVISLPFRGLCWEPRFGETFANRDAKWQQHAGEMVLTAKQLPLGLTRWKVGV